MKLFALEAGRRLGEDVAKQLGVELAPHEEREFEDGEHKSRPLVSVRGDDVFVIQSLYADAKQSVNDKLCRLLLFLGAIRDASAGSLTAVVPYLCYTRKDRKTKSRDPVSTRYIAALFEALGVDRVVTVDVHNLTAYQNAFRCRTDHLEARPLFTEHFAARTRGRGLTVVSPDIGGIKRAEQLRQSLEHTIRTPVTSAFVEKGRSGGVLTGGRLIGEVANRTVILVDDMVVTGSSLIRAAQACKEAGSGPVCAAATHGLFVGDANAVLADEALDELVVTDTVPPFRVHDPRLRAKLHVLASAPLLAQAINRIHTGGSLAELFSD